MEEEVPARTPHEQRPFLDVVCDCGISSCCCITLFVFLFLIAWSAQRHEIPPDEFNQVMYPFVSITLVVVLIWIFFKAYSRLTKTKDLS
ncbi:MAG: hypothetical protein ACFFCP_07375 [Promethearchaeota archaeon]